MKFTPLFSIAKTRQTNILKSCNGLYLAALAMLVVPSVANSQTKLAPPIAGVLGKIKSVNSSSMDVATPSGVVHVSIKQPLVTYKQMPSDLSQIGADSYVGVPSVRQADGTELAKLVLIFPKELQGAAEGSVLLSSPRAASRSRMTNGSVSRPSASRSRMTNGTAQKGSGRVLVVRYQDGSQRFSVPIGVPVMLVAKAQLTLGAGDTIYARTEKLADGTLTTNKVFQFIAASGK